jgi:hypothetical protein
MGGTYDPSKVNVILTELETKNSHAVTGFMNDSIVEINQNNDDAELEVGAQQGEWGWSINQDRSGVLVCHLKQTSDSNDWLTDIANKQQLVGGGILSMLVKDLSGRALHYAPEGRIARPADSEYGSSISERTWNIKLAKIDNEPRGNF